MTADGDRTPDQREGWPQIPPALAGILSFAAPGLGHLALRMWSRAAIWLIGWFVVGASAQASHSAPMLALMLIAGLDAYFCARDRQRNQDANEADTPPAVPR